MAKKPSKRAPARKPAKGPGTAKQNAAEPGTEALVPDKPLEGEAAASTAAPSAPAGPAAGAAPAGPEAGPKEDKGRVPVERVKTRNLTWTKLRGRRR